MTSAAKVRANQANARASTGPRTAAGARRSAKNALRHGLSRPVDCDPAFVAEVEALAHEIAATDRDGDIVDLARAVAEAQIDLHRVRLARYNLLSDNSNDPFYQSHAATRQNARFLSTLLSKKTQNVPVRFIEPFLVRMPQGPEKDALILLQELRALSALDRYEKRALSRRKFAIRALDDARRTLRSEPLSTPGCADFS